MDAPERADANETGGEGTEAEPENAHGTASAFRRALDAQAEADDPGQALVPSGPHDLTMPIDRGRILDALAEAESAENGSAPTPSEAQRPTAHPSGTASESGTGQPSDSTSGPGTGQPSDSAPESRTGQSSDSAADPEAETEAASHDPRTRVPPWSPSIHWVGAAPDGDAHGAAGNAPVGGGGAAASTAVPAGAAAGFAHRAPGGKAPRSERFVRAGAASAPSPDGAGRAKPGRLRLAVVASVALAAVSAIAIVLVDSGGADNPTSSALPAVPILSGTAALPAAGLSGAPGSASATARAGGSASASAKRSASASPHGSAGASAAQTASASANGIASPSAPGTAAAGTAAPGNSAAGPSLANKQNGKCLTTPGSAYSGGPVEQVAACGGSAFQTWTLTSSGQLTQDGGAYCLDDRDWGVTPGSEVDLWPCNGGSNQRWAVRSGGSIVGAFSHLCVSLTHGSSVALEPCDGQANQQWSWR